MRSSVPEGDLSFAIQREHPEGIPALADKISEFGGDVLGTS
jgi:hypothetical protein